jgi:protein SCO1/2
MTSTTIDPTESAEGEAFEVDDEQLHIPRWLKAAAVIFAMLVVAATAFAYFEPLKVLPRIRPAPGYSFVDQNGEGYNSEAARGKVTLYSFAPAVCDDCESIETTMADVGQRVVDSPGMADVDVSLVTIALDQPTEQELQQAVVRSGADGTTWRWVHGSSDQVKNVVGLGFRRYYEIGPDGDVEFDPGYVITDGLGVVRGEYRYQTLATDSDKLVSHLEILADEIKYAKGATAVAYEAAHLFLCYP